MKKNGIVFALILGMLLAVPALSHAGGGPDGRRGPAYQQPELSAEQQAALEKIVTEYREKAQPLRNDYWAKKTELHYLGNHPNTDAKTISKLVSDMRGITEKLQALQKTTADKIKKDVGISSKYSGRMFSNNWRGGCGARGFGGHTPGGGPRGGHGPKKHSSGPHMGGPFL